MFNIMLQLLDDGRLTDGQGRIVDFRNTIIILTSNLGSQLLLETDDPTQLAQQLEMLLKQTFKPEFLNRLDEIITFHRLSQEHILHILDLELNKLTSRLLDRQITLELTDQAMAHLAQIGFDPAFGARPLKRTVQTYVQNPLAKALLSGAYPVGSRVRGDWQDDQMVFSAKS